MRVDTDEAWVCRTSGAHDEVSRNDRGRAPTQRGTPACFFRVTPFLLRHHRLGVRRLDSSRMQSERRSGHTPRGHSPARTQRGRMPCCGPMVVPDHESATHERNRTTGHELPLFAAGIDGRATGSALLPTGGVPLPPRGAAAFDRLRSPGLRVWLIVARWFETPPHQFLRAMEWWPMHRAPCTRFLLMSVTRSTDPFHPCGPLDILVVCESQCHRLHDCGLGCSFGPLAVWQHGCMGWVRSLR